LVGQNKIYMNEIYKEKSVFLSICGSDLDKAPRLVLRTFWFRNPTVIS
jgi:hypothetical protein